MRLQLEGVRQAYGDKTVLDDVGFELQQGQIGCLLGPSGCGKTTVLRCIAGFEALQAGRISVGARVLSGPDTNVAPENRGVGMVFQHYALFPHLNVERNVAFGLRALAPAARLARVREMLEVTGMAAAASALPHELSGGQRQRVALARALAPQPGLLLLDEPFSNLDQDLRHRLSREVRDILRRMGATALLVTHDQHEAFAMADQVGVMHQGRIEQWDTPHNLYHRPGTPFVAGFIGRGAFVAGQITAPGKIRTQLGDLSAAGADDSVIGTQVQVLLRPDDIGFARDAALLARVSHRDFRGSHILYTLTLPGDVSVLALLASDLDFKTGSDIGICLQKRGQTTFFRDAS